MDIGQKMLFAFKGLEPNKAIKEAIREKQISGLTLFRYFNIENPAQVRKLTSQLQAEAREAGIPPLLIAADQEGGQLNALGEDTTQFPGNMALGATQDEALAEQVGAAIGTELAAMGVNINYAPVADVSTIPHNPSVGIRSFGDDPENVAKLLGAFVRGCQSAGVAATVKHFPGSGEAAVDPHYEVPVIDQPRSRLDKVELAPFVQAFKEDVKLVMTGHVSLPAITGDDSLPATLSKEIMDGLARKELGFAGVVVSDAIEMGAIAQGRYQLVDIIAATLAGVDLLLLNADEEAQERTYSGLTYAAGRKVISQEILQNSIERIDKLKKWVAQFPQPGIEKVACEEHQELAYKVSCKALTLVRNEEKLLPLKVSEDQKIAVIVPQPKDLTPADTSSQIKIDLAKEMMQYHSAVEQINIAHHPGPDELIKVFEKIKEFDLVIACSINAHMNEEQAEFMRKINSQSSPIISVALRTAYDLMAYPQAKNYLCTFGILPPSIKALAAALFGKIEFEGRLPAVIPDLYETGFRLGG